MTAHIFDLALADGRRPSPFCWAVKLALAHKGVAFETTPTRFIDIPAIRGGGFRTVPVTEIGPEAIGDSFALALRLEELHPEGPTLFGGPGGVALTRFVGGHVAHLMRKIARVIAVDICGALDAENQAYFRASREKGLGGGLEEIAADREGGVAAVRDALTPLKIMLRAQPFLGGEAPLFADFLLAGVVQWTRVVGTVDFLEGEEAVAAWFGHIEALSPEVMAAVKG